MLHGRFTAALRASVVIVKMIMFTVNENSSQSRNNSHLADNLRSTNKHSSKSGTFPAFIVCKQNLSFCVALSHKQLFVFLFIVSIMLRCKDPDSRNETPLLQGGLNCGRIQTKRCGMTRWASLAPIKLPYFNHLAGFTDFKCHKAKT